MHQDGQVSVYQPQRPKVLPGWIADPLPLLLLPLELPPCRLISALTAPRLHQGLKLLPGIDPELQCLSP